MSLSLNWYKFTNRENLVIICIFCIIGDHYIGVEEKITTKLIHKLVVVSENQIKNIPLYN